METNLQHEDLLIKLRAKLNEEKIKLWESPYKQTNDEISQSLQDLAKKYSTALAIKEDTILRALHELQLHSIDRSKANAEFMETGCATFRVKAMVPGEKLRMLRIQKKLNEMGSEMISSVSKEMNVEESRVKLIYNGKVIKPSPSLKEQGVKNGVLIMALIMADSPEEVKKEDTRYMEMKATRDDATLLSEYAEDLADGEEYMKLEDQSGRAVELPPAERRALMIGLALHERGRAAAKQKDYHLALVLLLEADRQFSECSSTILKTVDNWAVLQLDIAWCYLCLQNLSAATDAAARLARAEESFWNTYGENHQRLIALKGDNANERSLFMRLYLLQGIVAFHQNRRSEAKALLERAEAELNFLRVDESAVLSLMELGWSRAQARGGLRAAGGDRDRAHADLAERGERRRRARGADRARREQRALGLCENGTEVNGKLITALIAMGYSRKLATRALQQSNNHVADAVRRIQDHPEQLVESESSSDENTEPLSPDDPVPEPDNKLVAELETMGYEVEEAKTALRVTKNDVSGALDLLVAGGGHAEFCEDPANPSTSSGTVPERRRPKHKSNKRKKSVEMALQRLSSSIRTEEDDYLDTSLQEEEEFLAQYKSLL